LPSCLVLRWAVELSLTNSINMGHWYMHNFTRNLHLLYRTEKALAKAKLRLSTRKMILSVGVAVTVLFSIAMLNVAGYFSLEESAGKAIAALIVAAADLLIAIVLMVIANILQAAPEEQMVREVRDLAISEIEAEAAGVQKQLFQIQEDISGMRQTLVGFTRHPINALTSGAIGPAVSILTKAIRAKNSADSK
jgi:hypothetical protein